jgi:hypothetical protein
MSVQRFRKSNRLIRPVTVSPLFLLSRNTFQQLSNVALATGYPEMALQLLSDSRYDAPIQI